ncbi:MAG: PP2C family protein-serine/threonine phosphatase [Sphingomonadales bacterium]|nr:PP2C family protein-serine/threonine phosphatase [Sphingomonadales bacterium]
MNVDPLDVSKIGDYTPTRVTALRHQVDLLNRQLERMLENRLVQERMKQELSLAAQVQGFLIPDSLPNSPSLSMSAIYVPHHDVGGDYYDVVEMGRGKWLYCVADVAGKGVSAALLMAHLQASIRALLHAYTDLPTLVTNVNDLLGHATRSERFVTLFMGTLDEESGALQYVCAGHIPAVLYRNGVLQTLNKGTTLLGMFQPLPFMELGTCVLEPGDLLLICTDGVVEGQNEKQEPFGMDRLVGTICETPELSPDLVNSAVLGRLIAHRGGWNFVDDVTLLTIRYSGGGAGNGG